MGEGGGSSVGGGGSVKTAFGGGDVGPTLADSASGWGGSADGIGSVAEGEWRESGREVFGILRHLAAAEAATPDANAVVGR